MASNPNGKLPNRNTLYLGRSGTGKSQALKQNPEIPKAGVKVLLYDPNEDHRADRFRTKAAFGRAVLRGVKSGKQFRLAYTGGTCEADHEWFCRLVFSLLDGRKLLYVIDEELGAAGQRTGAAAPGHAKLMNQGRKYGLRYHGVVQFSQEVPKTVYRNCEIKYVGNLETKAAKEIAQELDIDWREIASLPALTFWVKDPAKGFQAYKQAFEYHDDEPRKPKYRKKVA